MEGKELWGTSWEVAPFHEVSKKFIWYVFVYLVSSPSVLDVQDSTAEVQFNEICQLAAI